MMSKIKEYDPDFIKKELKKLLSNKRYEHTISTADYSKYLSDITGFKDKNRLFITALLHDSAKEIDYIGIENLTGIKIEKNKRINIDYLEHGYLCSRLAEVYFGINDPEIIDAILYHPTGKPKFSMLGQMLFIADYLEPNRSYVPEAFRQDVEKISKKDISLAYFTILKVKLKSLITRNRVIIPISLKAYNNCIDN